MKIQNKKLVAATASIVIGVGFIAAALGDEHGSERDNDGRDDAKVVIGLRIAPVALNLRGKNPELVGLGSYIVNAQSACNDCHTHPSFAAGGDPYAGQPEVVNSAQYLTGGRLFGPFKSPNLTPDQFGRPAGLTFEAFKHAIRTGLDPDGPRPPLPPFLQVMPWPVYAKMTDRDLRAIYEYLRAIPSRPNNPNPGP